MPSLNIQHGCTCGDLTEKILLLSLPPHSANQAEDFEHKFRKYFRKQNISAVKTAVLSTSVSPHILFLCLGGNKSNS